MLTYEESSRELLSKPSSPQQEASVRNVECAILLKLSEIMGRTNEAVKSLNKNSHFSKLVGVICQLTQLRKEDYPQLLELLKFNIIKAMFYDSEVRIDQIRAFDFLARIDLIHEKSLSDLWSKFGEATAALVRLCEESHLKVHKEEFCMRQLNMLVDKMDFSKVFSLAVEKEKEVIEAMQKINIIFDEADLMVVSWICQNWRRETNISPAPKTLVVGKTKSGKSSLLRFLSGDANVKVGADLDSETFFPTLIRIPLKSEASETMEEAWDLPGLEENKGKIFKLCTGYFLRILSENKKIKIWYMIRAYGSFFSNTEDYVRLNEFLGELLGWDPNNLRCINFIFSDIAGTSESNAKKTFEKSYGRVLKMDEGSAKQIYSKLR